MTAYWPTGMTIRPLTQQPPTPAGQRVVSNFSAPWRTTLELLTRELTTLRARSAVLEVDIPSDQFRLDGYPRENARQRSPAVALSFDRPKPHPMSAILAGKVPEYDRLRFACDKFTDWRDNVRAIALGLEALRKVDRYGISHGGEQYAGWKEIGPPTMPGDEKPLDILARYAGGAIPGESALSIYRRAIRRTHPDTGGDRTAFEEVQRARERLEAAGTF